MDDIRGKTVAGTFAHAPSPDRVEILADALVTVDEHGDIAAVATAGDARFAAVRDAAERAGKLVTMPADSVVLPGFVDLHIHAPQYPQLGTALDVPLEVWLQKHTFPLEARYADPAFAARIYPALVADLLANGTTTAVYFATIHAEATRLLVDACLASGQRAFIGKVAMDNPDECPPFYRDASAADAIAGTEALIDYVRTHPDNAGLVEPVVTPRFVPSCTDPLLDGLGAVAKDCGCAVQTHCSESDWQHGHALARFGLRDAEVLDRYGLLSRRTVLAHGNLLSAGDMALVKARGAGIAHCPLSNVYFSNAVFPLRAALERGVRVGLGTDIAGGPSASILDSCRMAVHASRMLEEGVDPDHPPERRGRPGSRIDFAAALHLATAGGADVLDLPVGRFAAGFAFDAVLVDPAAPEGTMRVYDDLDTPEDVIQKIIFTASRANLRATWVAGRRRSGEG
ncbi:MAG: guanine deaminase [Bauldia sp.]|nr:guanine deaminase [Bauldia sp.]